MAFNPLFTVNVRLIGTWRSFALVGGIFSALVAGFAASFYSQADPAQRFGVSFGFLSAMSIAQGVFLLLVGASAVRKAVLRDFTTNMIESHRIAPMSGFKIVLGYLTGPPAQAYLLYLLATLFGTGFAMHCATGMGATAGNVLFAWYSLQAALLSVALLLMSLVLLVALASSGKTNLVGILVVFSLLGGPFALPFVPGLALLVGVFSGGVLAGLLTPAAVGPTSSPATLAYTALFQLGFSAILLTAAARKIRAPERAMFSMPLGFGLAALWAVLLIVGLHIAPQNPWLGTPDDARPVQIACSLLTLMIVSQFALVAAASERHQIDRASAFGAAAPAAKRFGTAAMRIALCLLAVLTYLAMLHADSSPPAGQHASESVNVAMMIAFSLFLSYLTDSCWLYSTLVRGGRVFLTIIALAAAFKAVPPAIDLALLIAQALFSNERSFVGVITTISPAGSLVLAVLPSGAGAVGPGLIVQAGLALYAIRKMIRARKSLRLTAS